MLVIMALIYGKYGTNNTTIYTEKISMVLIYKKYGINKSKVGNHSRGRLEGSLFNCYFTKV